MGLRGWVLNSSAGLVVEAEGTQAELLRFLERLEAERPKASVVLAREIAWLAPAGFAEFAIRPSESATAPDAAVLPDLATCPECLAEIRTPGARRFQYPFTNCTLCGPRYTIVLDIPYDRPNTTMRSFALCPDCEREYRDPADRRFHAQPVACPRCGPSLDAAIEDASAALSRGEIVALKGIGGYQLLVDARNEAAVERLRRRKKRDAKPFAMMMPDLETVRRYCRVSPQEERVLESPASPIVLLEPQPGATELAGNISDASPFLAVMLPYSPLHHLLMRAFPHPVVATSGNLSGDPIATHNHEARRRLGAIADLFVSHNRPIARPCDDSVVRVSLGREMVLRRARGYAPLPVRVGRALPRVLAVGSHLKNTVAIALGQNVYLSQHIGDLDTAESRQAFENAIADLCRLYRFEPDCIACDLHPDYASTSWAREQGKPVVAVQHHMAHAASCAAENDVRGPYLAVVWDGAGYGADGTIWGGEFFLIDESSIVRIAHLQPFPLPGGEAAIREGWRSAASILWKIGEEVASPVIRRMLERGVNCPQTTSVGRLFDAVAALTGVAAENRFEGQAAMLLERAARAAGSGPRYEIARDGDWTDLACGVVRDVRRLVCASEIARGFHEALARWIEDVVRQTGVHQVVLSGGVFQNALLAELASRRLESLRVSVYRHQRIPPNDGGIALGQAVLAPRACEIG